MYLRARTTCDSAFRLTLLGPLTTSRNCRGPSSEPLVFVVRTNPVAVQLKTDGRTRARAKDFGARTRPANKLRALN